MNLSAKDYFIFSMQTFKNTLNFRSLKCFLRTSVIKVHSALRYKCYKSIIF